MRVSEWTLFGQSSLPDLFSTYRRFQEAGLELLQLVEAVAGVPVVRDAGEVLRCGLELLSVLWLDGKS